jgi:hypothetical protein
MISNITTVITSAMKTPAAIAAGKAAIHVGKSAGQSILTGAAVGGAVVLGMAGAEIGMRGARIAVNGAQKIGSFAKNKVGSIKFNFKKAKQKNADEVQRAFDELAQDLEAASKVVNENEQQSSTFIETLQKWSFTGPKA